MIRSARVIVFCSCMVTLLSIAVAGHLAFSTIPALEHDARARQEEISRLRYAILKAEERNRSMTHELEQAKAREKSLAEQMVRNAFSGIPDRVPH